jgi:hypothetical protein
VGEGRNGGRALWEKGRMGKRVVGEGHDLARLEEGSDGTQRRPNSKRLVKYFCSSAYKMNRWACIILLPHVRIN